MIYGTFSIIQGGGKGIHPSFPSVRGELSETAPISECEGHKQYYILLGRINFLRFLLSHKIHPEESVPTPFYLHRSKMK
jgi:hypothetical protein